MNKKKKKILTGFLVLLVFFTAGSLLLGKVSSGIPISEVSQVKIAGNLLRVDVAITQADQAQGLSGRKSMKDTEGMLFVFEKPGKYGFWMKDMNFPIDMIWIGDDSRVVFVQKNATPASYPQVFGGNADSRYVLEVVSGFSEKNNVKVGDKVDFVR